HHIRAVRGLDIDASPTEFAGPVLHFGAAGEVAAAEVQFDRLARLDGSRRHSAFGKVLHAEEALHGGKLLFNLCDLLLLGRDRLWISRLALAASQERMLAG